MTASQLTLRDLVKLANAKLSGEGRYRGRVKSLQEHLRKITKAMRSHARLAKLYRDKMETAKFSRTKASYEKLARKHERKYSQLKGMALSIRNRIKRLTS